MGHLDPPSGAKDVAHGRNTTARRPVTRDGGHLPAVASVVPADLPAARGRRVDTRRPALEGRKVTGDGVGVHVTGGTRDTGVAVALVGVPEIHHAAGVETLVRDVEIIRPGAPAAATETVARLDTVRRVDIPIPIPVETASFVAVVRVVGAATVVVAATVEVGVGLLVLDAVVRHSKGESWARA